ncbi:hypothetical protein HDV04_000228 [Boothiomyces sp. JEL0838]|nr:hypothetical protein HDV04_000228 [Boothiomyces sp. JEL0838]
MKFPKADTACRPSTECVDYFHHEFDFLDLHTCWRKANLQGKHTIEAKRRENATWRKYFQNKYNIPKCNPQDIDWYKDNDVLWFYGPFFAHKESETAPLSRVPSSNSISDLKLKPSLKRMIRPKEILPVITTLKKTLSDSCLIDPNSEIEIERPLKDIESPVTPKDVVSEFFKQEKQKTKKHIRFSTDYKPTKHGFILQNFINHRDSLAEKEDATNSKCSSTIRRDSRGEREEFYSAEEIYVKEQIKTLDIQSDIQLQAIEISEEIFITKLCESPIPLRREIKDSFVYRQSSLLDLIENDAEYQQDTHLPYPPYEEDELEEEEDPEVIKQDTIRDQLVNQNVQYNVREYICDSIKNTIEIGLFVFHCAKSISFWQ